MIYPLYHDIGDLGLSGFQNQSALPYKVSEEQFDSHLDIFSKRPQHVICTFDDGGKSNLVAAKKLKKSGIDARFFIVSKYIGKPGFLSREDIVKILEMGFSVGLHSHSHPRIISDLPDEEQFDEWSKCKSILEDITNTKINCASFPGGNFNKKTFDILRQLGILDVYHSAPYNFSIPGMNVFSRLTVKSRISTFTVHRWVNYPTTRFFVETPKHMVKQSIKYMLGEKYKSTITEKTI